VVAGKLSTGHNVKVGYLSQHAEELSLALGPPARHPASRRAGRAQSHPAARTVLEATQHLTGLPPTKARALLGRFLFGGEDAEKPLDGLSGGERRRLSLAILVHAGANVLILDEPTNHLDLESREALEQALSEFPGSLLLVSHDRALLDAVGSRTVAFEDGALESHLGGWPEYVRVREERQRERTRAAAAKPRRRRQRPAKATPAGRGDARSTPDQRRIEQQIEEAETALRAVEEELADPAAWATSQQTARSTARHHAAKAVVDELYARWERTAG
jgi:ATP-binding cassette subfamily F protein 3